jgi:ubiquinone/menaquinone biosynthesis C-methylase UbiE
VSVEALAGTYPETRRFSPEAAALARVIKTQLKKLPTRVLVVGCGNGHHAAQLAVSLDADVTGIECQSRFDPTAAVYATLHACDLRAYRFGDGAFDFVYSHQNFEHVSTLRASLSEMRRVLARRGFTSPELRSELIAAFGEAFDVTQPYYTERNNDFNRLSRVWWSSGLGASLVPSRYFVGRRTDPAR